MEFQDYYATMGVGRDSTAAEIKRAYRQLARKFHPDVSKEADAEAQFKKVGEAYAVLKDPEKRAAYDQLGEDHKAGQDFSAPPGWNAGFEFGGPGGGADSQFDESDFFSALFGGRSNQQSTHATGQTADHHAKIVIDLEDTVSGANRKFTLRVPEIDSSGHLRLKERTIAVKIPRGIKPGQHIRLSGLGAADGGGALTGDLYLEIEFAPHPIYRIDGHDLYIDLPLTPWEAALGCKVKLPTLAGAVDLQIPAGSSNGKKLRLKGRGIPSQIPGDLYAIIEIALPPADTEASKSLYRKMQQELDFNPRAHLAA